MLESLGFGIRESETRREANGAWTVNGRTYAADDTTFQDRSTGIEMTNGELPDWFPFAELVLAGEAFTKWRATPTAKLEPAKGLDPTWLASFLIDWALAGATLEELGVMMDIAPDYGLAGDVEKSPALLRQYFAAIPLLAALNSLGDVGAFNVAWQEIAAAVEPWNRGEAAPYSMCVPGSAANLQAGQVGIDLTGLENTGSALGAPGCTGVLFDASDLSIVSTYDEQGRWVRPWRGDFAKRAKSMIKTLRTGEVMQMATASEVGNFASFSQCVMSGDEACLTDFPIGPEVWKRLNEPWREGYNASDKIQIVTNRFGRFLAWDFGKPRGISLNVAMAISAPLVLGLAGIGVAAWYFGVGGSKKK